MIERFHPAVAIPWLAVGSRGSLGLLHPGSGLAKESGLLITVATFTEPWEAHIFRGRLEVEGIPAWVAHDQHVWIDWALSNALGGVKVQVPPAFAEEACVVEKNYRNAAYLDDLLAEQPDITDVRCPECRSARCRSPATGVKFVSAALSFWVAGVIFPPGGDWRVCGGCGFRWEGER